MKKILPFLFVLISLGTMAQTGLDSLIKFEKETHAFGKIKKDKPVTIAFNFTNASNKPIIIESATAECGCTTPIFPKTPIAKGKKGKITVTYDAKTMGSFTKKVTVKLVNITQTKILTINGEVIE